ncbi:MAG: hypothetical protein JRJ45_09055 [Deltaproteobacteria bacterium]|nr:hypothetical protein [Deltaproteobacteria bacterium]
MKELLRNLKPGVFEDIVASVALYRPGPLGSNMVDDFIKRKHGEIKKTYLLPQNRLCELPRYSPTIALQRRTYCARL